VFIGVLSFVIMFPLSFSYVDVNEYGLKRNTATNAVDRNTVYSEGRYFWGLARQPQTFPRSFQRLEYSTANNNQLSIFTETGQTMYLSCVLFYTIEEDLLPTMYLNFATTYSSKVDNIARAEIRNVAPLFSLDQFQHDRTNISQTIEQQLKLQLQLKAYVRVPDNGFHLLDIQLPQTVLDQKLTIFEVNQSQITNNNSIAAQLVRLNTSIQVTAINNTALFTTANATITANRLTAEATNEAFALVESVKGTLLATLISDLAITTDSGKSNLVRYLALLDAQTGVPTMLQGITNAIVNLAG